MTHPAVRIDCEITGRHFRDYARFDTLVRNRRWRTPALFALIMCAFALVCFALHARDGAILLGCLLASIGLILPAGYLGHFLLNLSTVTKKMPVSSFTILADNEAVTMQRGDKTQSWPWRKLTAAYRLPGLICLYPNPQQAFLAAGSMDELDALWLLATTHMAPDTTQDRR